MLVAHRSSQASEKGLAFAFSEGALVKAIRNGDWVLLDEMNLASGETLQRLFGLLDGPGGTVTVTERGDTQSVPRHPDFRLFAAMNPATDAGKKDLPPAMRSRFTEVYVPELTDAAQLRLIAEKYLRPHLQASPPGASESSPVFHTVDVYLRCRALAAERLVDGSNHRPRYTLRTLCRALAAAVRLMTRNKLSLQRAIYEVRGAVRGANADDGL